MKRFDRKFTVDDLADDEAVNHLFSRWALPGEAIDAHRRLRIGIRTRYLNLYVRGQSVAKVSIVGKQTRFEVHPVYVGGYRKGEPRPENLGTRAIARFSGDVTPAMIDQWIAVAETYSGAEKAFVDDLVAANPGTIDLEMGLPANTGERTAPRMDLVLAQGGAVVFWEAKCSDNSELRAIATYAEDDEGRHLSGIHVINQLRKYCRWMATRGCDRSAEVAQAYHDAARILLDLAKRFAAPGAEARVAWQSLADAERPEVILPPGLVIGNYAALNGTITAPSDTADAPYERAGTGNAPYIATIRSHGATVFEVGRQGSRVLPLLTPGDVRA